MVFNSWVFFAFFWVVYLLYLPLRKSAANWLILVASYVFYGYWDWRFVPLLFGIGVFSVVAAIGCAAIGCAVVWLDARRVVRP